MGVKNGCRGLTLGDDCELGMNYVVPGDIKIGNRVKIGVRAVATKSLVHVLLKGIPAHI